MLLALLFCAQSDVIRPVHTYSIVAVDTERDNFMSGEESVKYGLIDEVIELRAGGKKGES